MLFSRQTILQTVRLLLIAFAVLVVVFAIEKFDFVLRTAIEYDVGLLTFLILFAAIIPSVMDSIIPIATLVSVYFVLLGKREGREFLILSAAGCGATPVLQITGVVATAAVAGSLLISGYVKPFANAAFRTEYEKALSEVVGRGPQPGRFFDSANTVLHVWRDPAEGARKMRVFSFEQKRLDQIFISDCSKMHVQDGHLLIDACEARIFAFPKPSGTQQRDDAAAPALAAGRSCRICPDENGALEVVRIRGGESRRTFDMKTMFRPLEGDRSAELTLPELLRAEGGTFGSFNAARKGATQILLAIVNILAVTLAIVAIAFTSHASRFAALPVAVALLMGGLVLAGSGVLLPRILTVAGLLATVGLVAGVSAATLVAAVLLMRDRLNAPRLVRS